jgi:hypothetical protein
MSSNSKYENNKFAETLFLLPHFIPPMFHVFLAKENEKKMKNTHLQKPSRKYFSIPLVHVCFECFPQCIMYFLQKPLRKI